MQLPFAPKHSVIFIPQWCFLSPIHPENSFYSKFHPRHFSGVKSPRPIATANFVIINVKACNAFFLSHSPNGNNKSRHKPGECMYIPLGVIAQNWRVEKPQGVVSEEEEGGCPSRWGARVLQNSNPLHHANTVKNKSSGWVRELRGGKLKKGWGDKIQALIRILFS